MGALLVAGLSALPMMPSQSSLNKALSWDMFCRMMVAMMLRDRMVACKRAYPSGRATFANSSNIRRTGIGRLPPCFLSA